MAGVPAPAGLPERFIGRFTAAPLVGAGFSLERQTPRPGSSPPTEPCSPQSAASCHGPAGPASSSSPRRCCAGTAVCMVAGVWTYPRRGYGRPPLDEALQALILPPRLGGSSCAAKRPGSSPATSSRRHLLAPEGPSGPAERRRHRGSQPGPPHKDILICGPPVMVRNLTGQLRTRGVPRDVASVGLGPIPFQAEARRRARRKTVTAASHRTNFGEHRLRRRSHATAWDARITGRVMAWTSI